jgi:hypothetical protein
MIENDGPPVEDKKREQQRSVQKMNLIAMKYQNILKSTI